MHTLITAGKGGTGKTQMLYHLLQRHLLTDLPGRLLVVDADPHQSLTTLLDAPPAETLGHLKKRHQHAIKRGVGLQLDMSRQEFADWLTRQALIHLDERADLLVMGRSDTRGCQCSVNNLLGQALDTLADEYDWVIVDNEAGIEHIGRHGWPVDILLLISGAQPMELAVARRIMQQAEDTGREIRHPWTVINRLQQQTVPVGALPAPFLGALPFSVQMAVSDQPDKAWFKALDALWKTLRQQTPLLREGSRVPAMVSRP